MWTGTSFAYLRVVELSSFLDAGHGYDEFGAHPETLKRALPFIRMLHDRYFRVKSHDVNRVPEEGGMIFVSNHSGTLPFDGAMIVADVLLHRNRLIRPVADRFLPMLPFFGTLLTRLGAVTGSRGNVEYLLERGEPILIFPEGTSGVGKPWAKRYELQDWRVGHAELAIRHGVPVVPVAVIGAEEQMPQVARISKKLLGAPYIPIPLTPIPLPVQYHLFYGEPINLNGYDADAAKDVRTAALEVRAQVEDLMHHGLLYRSGVFS